jgi:hypothetical protein
MRRHFLARLCKARGEFIPNFYRNVPKAVHSRSQSESTWPMSPEARIGRSATRMYWRRCRSFA